MDGQATVSETLIFDALSDGVRRQILEHLGEKGECSVTELANHIDSVGRTTVSSHLRLLRTSGVVRERRDGRKRYYSIDPEGSVSAAVRYLQRILYDGVADVAKSSPAGSEQLGARTGLRRSG
jgi:ArsR family transcriptional regulator